MSKNGQARECHRSVLPEQATKEHSYTLVHGAVMCPEGDAAGRSQCRFLSARRVVGLDGDATQDPFNTSQFFVGSAR